MSRRAVAALVLLLIFAAACDRGPGRPPGLEGAGPLVAEFAEAAKELNRVARAVARQDGDRDQEPGNSSFPVSVVNVLVDLGATAGAVYRAAEPEGEAGAAALSEAVAKAAADVVRYLVSLAETQQKVEGTVALDQPAMVIFDIVGEVPPEDPEVAPPPGRNRTPIGIAEARSRLKGDLTREIEHFVYVALLANPRTRATLAPRLSPDDLPAEVPDLNLTVATRDEWREQLFDNQNRLVVPSPYDPGRWKSFLAWAETVNPAIRNAVSDLRGPAFRLVR